MKTKKKRLPRKVGNYYYLGAYIIGCDKLDVLAETGNSGGSFWLLAKTKRHPDERCLSRIVVGVGGSSWRDCFEVLMHEALELALTRLHVRYRDSIGEALTSGDYHFYLDHAQFTEACATASELVVEATPSLARVYAAEENKRRKDMIDEGC